MDSEELKRRTNKFAHRCVKLALSLPDNKLGRHISGQLIRCSSSVAANYRAVCLSQSEPTFVAKLSIVFEEADESAFWIQFAVDENLVTPKKIAELLKEAIELSKIFGAARITLQKRRTKKSSKNIQS